VNISNDIVSEEEIDNEDDDDDDDDDNDDSSNNILEEVNDDNNSKDVDDSDVTTSMYCYSCDNQQIGGKAMICDRNGCERICHPGCDTPSRTKIPKGKWYCSIHRSKKNKTINRFAHQKYCQACNETTGQLLKCIRIGCTYAYHSECSKATFKDVHTFECDKW
jgi:hypothetical protein